MISSKKFTLMDSCIYILFSTAEKNGIAWRDMAREILESEVYKEKELIENPSIVYPDCKMETMAFTCVDQF